MAHELYDIEAVLGLTKEQLPKHIAMIMDGNGRWAQRQGKPRFEGHLQGANIVQRLATECAKLGIGYLTLYTFSTENWRRPKEEVAFLMQLCVDFLANELELMMDLNIKLKHLGRAGELAEPVQKRLSETLAKTAGNTGLTLTLALNYSSRVEITDAMQIIGRKVASNEITPEQITEDMISENLYTAGMPDPDLLVRTAGERRLSNYLLWQLAYTEFYIDNVCWPDFDEEHLRTAIKDYADRERKFGKIGKKL